MVPTEHPQWRTLPQATRLSPSSLRPDSFKYDSFKWPYPDNVCHHINEARHGEIIREDGLAQCRMRRHPISSLCSLQTIYHELCHGEWVQTPKHGCSSSLEATFQKPEVKYGVFYELLMVPTSQIASKASVSTCGPLCRDTTDVSGPVASAIFAKNMACTVVLALNRLNTATQTRRNVDLSHFRTSTQISDPRSSNSMLRCPCAFA